MNGLEPRTGYQARRRTLQGRNRAIVPIWFAQCDAQPGKPENELPGEPPTAVAAARQAVLVLGRRPLQ